MKLFRSLVGLVVLPVLLISAVGHAQAEDEQATSDRRCLPISHIRRIEIIDDYTLRFHMSGGTDYVNRFPHRCGGLKSRGTFMHSTSTQNYCDLDVITVVDTSLGMRLGSCPLGKFEALAKGEEIPERE